jgi:D-alanyl-D-alanine carboxypeptidase
MTAYVTCKLLDEIGINPNKVFLRVSKVASCIGGTSAYLREGQRVSVYDLLVGLMLPSGNDAAIVLAEHFGRYLVFEKNKKNYQSFSKVCELDPFSPVDSKVFVRKFVKKMNATAKLLKLTNTQFSNPHGLSDKANRSTAADISRLAFAALKIKMFREIVEFKSYKTNQVFQLNL